MRNILIIIPARGGSKGIPRKNLRSLNGRPLISYVINTALSSQFRPDIYVSSEDDEILSYSKKSGAKVVLRDCELSDDSATLDSVIHDAHVTIEKLENKKYEIVITIQPTSPLLSVQTLDLAIEYFFNNPKIETLISAIEDTHLTWIVNHGKFVPMYEKRLNRQYLPKVYRETGALLLTRPSVLISKSRIGKIVDIFPVSRKESVDIDSIEDWAMCEYYLRQRKVLFVLTGNSEIGMGHVYNCLLIANELAVHDIKFLVDSTSQLAFDKIKSMNYQVSIQKSDEIIEDIVLFRPDIVINDLLDTNELYVKSLKERGFVVVNFEDLGPGSVYADLVFNPIYSATDSVKNHFFGYKYFLLRDDFFLTQDVEIKSKVSNVLLAFGGVDPMNYTLRVISIIQKKCLELDIKITVVLGMGYNKHQSLDGFTNIYFIQNVANIVDYFQSADIIFTSAGRTTYEIATQGVPTIVIAQNERELTHKFACEENGFINLGHGDNLSDILILNTFLELVENHKKRELLSKRMKSLNLSQGKERVITLINNLINQKKS